jgi:hypothetical protein
VKHFFKEGKAITDLFNNKFVAEIQNIATAIENEGKLKRGMWS